MSTLAGNGVQGSTSGVGAAASLNHPHDVAVTPDGLGLLVIEYGGHRVTYIDIASQAVSVFAGSGVAGATDGVGGDATFNAPDCVAVSPDGTTAVVCDQLGHRIRAISMSTRVVTTVAGSGVAGHVDGVGSGSQVHTPIGVAFDPTGDSSWVVVGDQTSVRVVDLVTQQVTTIAGLLGTIGNAVGSGSATRLDNVAGLEFSRDGSVLYVADLVNHVIKTIDMCPTKVRRPRLARCSVGGLCVWYRWLCCRQTCGRLRACG